MKLILVYGPPAVGKLTIAKALAEQTGYKLFHNHLSVDVVSAIFERGTPSFYKMVRQIRSTLFEEAAKANINMNIYDCVRDAA